MTKRDTPSIWLASRIVVMTMSAYSIGDVRHLREKRPSYAGLLANLNLIPPLGSDVRPARSSAMAPLQEVVLIRVSDSEIPNFGHSIIFPSSPLPSPSAASAKYHFSNSQWSEIRFRKLH